MVHLAWLSVIGLSCVSCGLIGCDRSELVWLSVICLSCGSGISYVLSMCCVYAYTVH